MSTSTCYGTRQRPFDLWLILRAWSHTPEALLETSSQAGHVLAATAQQGQTTTPGTPCPKLFVIIQFDLSVEKLTQCKKSAAPTAVLYTTVKQNDH